MPNMYIIATGLLCYLQEQYFFTYEAVAEAIMCGDTECSLSDLPDHVEKLNQITEGSALLEKEFKVRVLCCINQNNFWLKCASQQ